MCCCFACMMWPAVAQEEMTLAARRVSLAPTNRANNQSRSMSWRNGSLHWGRLAGEGSVSSSVSLKSFVTKFWFLLFLIFICLLIIWISQHYKTNSFSFWELIICFQIVAFIQFHYLKVERLLPTLNSETVWIYRDKCDFFSMKMLVGS